METTHSRDSISAFIICCNEAQHMRRCLESLSFCDEIVVIVDTKSTDATWDISNELAHKVIRKEWEGFVKQKAFGLSQCTGDWVLNLDADEEVSPELRKEIEEVLVSDTPSVGFYLLRVVWHLGRWWRTGGWYPEYRLRLCRRSATLWGGADPHEKAEVDGPTELLKGELRHYTYNNLADQIHTNNSFSSSSAKTVYLSGKRATIFQLTVHPAVRFIKFFFLKRGYKEGFAGFIVAVIESYYVFLKYAKLWELQFNEQQDKESNEVS